MDTRDDIVLTAVTSDRDGECMRVRLEFVCSKGLHQSYIRSMPPEEYGRFSFGLHRALGVVGPMTLVRLRLNEGLLVGIGHATEDQWFDPRPAHETAAERKRTSATEAALLHINNRRARIGQRDLDPVASKWTDDDVLIHARELGWRPT